MAQGELHALLPVVLIDPNLVNRIDCWRQGIGMEEQHGVQNMAFPPELQFKVALAHHTLFRHRKFAMKGR